MSEMAGEITPNPPVNTGSGPGIDRPQPTDPDGSVASGWRKIAPPSDGGWSDIDDVGDDGTPVWRQC